MMSHGGAVIVGPIPGLCGVSIFSLVLQFPPTAQKHLFQLNRKI